MRQVMPNDIIVADLTPLEWRGFASSMLSTPFIINTWFSGKIANALEKRDEWCLGYGLFAIIMPVALGAAVAALIWLDRLAKKKGSANIASSTAARRTIISSADQENQERASNTITIPGAGNTKQQWTHSLKANLEGN